MADSFAFQSWFPTSSMPIGGTPQQMGRAYNDAQSASRNANALMAQQINAGYDRVIAQQRRDLNRGFGFLRGTNRANIRDIDKEFTKLSGSIAQGLIDRGLGNSTIQGSMQTGVANARADAKSRSRAEFGDKLYKAYSNNALANSSLATQQLNFLGSIDIGYPDAGAYLAASQQAGMGGGGMGSGQTVVGDMSRPTGGAQPAWAYYGGGDAGQNVMPGGGYYGGQGGYSYANAYPQGPQQAASAYGKSYFGDLYPAYDLPPQESYTGSYGAAAQGGGYYGGKGEYGG
jgi:hypothetical protein